VNLSICDVCDDYCDIYDACDEYYDIYDACGEYYDIYDIPVIFGYFKREKNCNGHFAVRLPEGARQSDQAVGKPSCWQSCRSPLPTGLCQQPSLPCCRR
jgi:hypothetical protein